MSLGRVLTMNNGVKVPAIGFGTWLAAPGEVGASVTQAIKTGFRQIDCAVIYGNQPEVAEGIKAASVPREELILVGKLWNNCHRPSLVESDLDRTLKELDTSYLDVYLIHWPVAMEPGNVMEAINPENPNERWIDTEAPGIVETWKELIRISKQTNKVRAIGVSNCTIEHLEKLINATGVVPAMNQIECHAGLNQPELFEYCKKKGIIITCYSPLGNNFTGKPKIMDQPEIVALAKKLGKTPAQVCIAWCANQGFNVLSKSVTPSRIQSNFEDFVLSDEDFEAVTKVGEKNPMRANCPADYTPYWPINIFDTEKEKGFKLAVW